MNVRGIQTKSIDGVSVFGRLYHKLDSNLFKSRKNQIKLEEVLLRAIKCLLGKVNTSYEITMNLRYPKIIRLILKSVPKVPKSLESFNRILN